MYSGYSWGHGFGFMWVFPLLFLIAFLLMMWGVFGKGSRFGGSDTRPESAREILDKRFARGEINNEEYAEMKKTLGSDR